ncbi:MAG TPA: hypothetical protein VIY49_06870 [Bryobacteraceae bacterium]
MRFFTSTLAGNKFVPWLASVGELAYSPQSPPDRDYHFQYSWVIPAIFRAGVNLRRHFWFGGPRKDCAGVRLLFEFWNTARRGKVDAVFVANGMAAADSVTAPLAVYRHSQIRPFARARVILIQHGSYLIAESESQSHLDRGEATLYRGVQDAELFLLRRLTTAGVRSRLMSIHARTLEDSVTSFNAVHCNVARTETGSFNDRSFMLSDLCRERGLDPAPPARVAALLRVRIGGMVRSAEIRAELREAADPAHEHPHYELRLQ